MKETIKKKLASVFSKNEIKAKRVKIAGDHSSYHCGSYAVYKVICNLVREQGVLVEHKDDYDVLIVNGEGSMHHNSASMMNKIKEIEKALESGKEVHLVNTVWQENDQVHADVLKNCTTVVAREELSRRELESQGVNATVQYDASYFYEIDESSSFIDFEGKVVFTDFWSSEFKSFVILNSRWPAKFQRVDMTSMSWSSLIRSLRTASLLVTGRHHAVYAACKSETPFLAMPGNTHKIEGIFETAGVNQQPIRRDFNEIKSLVDKGDLDECRQSCGQLFEVMRQQTKWGFSI